MGQLLYSVNMPIREVDDTGSAPPDSSLDQGLLAGPPLPQCPVIYKYIYGACCVPGYLHDCLILLSWRSWVMGLILSLKPTE